MDIFDKAKRSEIMSKVRSKETKIEKAFRKSLSIKGLRFRKNSPHHFGTPDVIFVSRKLAVFVDSCFWHGCNKHFRLPSQNKAFWRKKIDRNIARDKEVIRHYRKMKWNILRIWEHELKRDPDKAADKVLKVLGKKSTVAKR